MKYILIIITISLISCGGSRKPKAYEGMEVYKIVPCNDINKPKDSVSYCKYFGGDPEIFERPFKFIDTCGKFKIGDVVYPKFVVYE